jgi:hypothetical protein
MTGKIDLHGQLINELSIHLRFSANVKLNQSNFGAAA